VLFTVVAIVAGLFAASSVGSAISDAGTQPRSDAQIRAALGAVASSPRFIGSPSATPSPAAAGKPKHEGGHRHHSAPTTPVTPNGGGTGSTTAPYGPQQTSQPTPQPTTHSGGGHHNGPGGSTGGSTGGGEQRATLGSSAGTVVASCAKGTVTLLTWSPALGYRVNEVQRGPSREADISFSADNHSQVTMVVTCGSDGRPRATVETDGSGEH
jgi:hypothetical protein